MKNQNTHDPGADPMQGEGDRVSARRYNRSAREFVAEGKVDEAAREAADYVEAEPEDAERAEETAREESARRVPHRAGFSVDSLAAKGRAVMDRLRPLIEGVVDRVRSRLGRTTGHQS